MFLGTVLMHSAFVSHHVLYLMWRTSILIQFGLDQNPTEFIGRIVSDFYFALDLFFILCLCLCVCVCEDISFEKLHVELHHHCWLASVLYKQVGQTDQALEVI